MQPAGMHVIQTFSFLADSGATVLGCRREGRKLKIQNSKAELQHPVPAYRR